MFNKPLNRWWNVVAGFLGNAVGAGVVATYVLGIFTKTVSQEFGWERSYTTAGLSCFYIVSGLGSIFLGSLLTRHSIRAVTITFVALFALVIASIGILPPSLLIFCLVFALMGLFASAATAMPYAIAISRQFDSNRGLALAVMVSGAGLGAIVLPSFANHLMEAFGWRKAYAGLGTVVGLVACSGLLFFFRTPEIPAEADREPVASLREIYTSTGPFWLIALPIFLISVVLIGLISNLVPILTDRGMSGAQAASMIGVIGAASWISRIGVGTLLDHLHAKYIATCIFAFAAMGTALVLVGAEGVWIYAAVICLGLGIGAEADLLTYMMSRYFPPRTLSRALGAVWIFWAWGNACGVFIGSLSFDRTGSYDAALIGMLTFAVFSCIPILLLGPYKYGGQGIGRGLRK